MSLLKSIAHLNPWIYLFAAGICEMGFTTFMKLSDGFRNWAYDVAFAICAYSGATWAPVPAALGHGFRNDAGAHSGRIWALIPA